MSDSDRSQQDPDESADGGSSRYGTSSGPRGSGHQDSKKLERKETHGDFVPRQGGDQSRHGQTSGRPRDD
jgi:hypothetical protein